ATRLSQVGKGDEALAALQKLLEANPGSFEVRRELAAALARLRRFDEARAAYEEAARLAPGLASTLGVGLGRVELEMGKLADAEASAQLALATDPGNARLLMARVALARKDPAAAFAHARAALDDRAAEGEAAVLLAQLYLQRNEADKALAV